MTQEPRITSWFADCWHTPTPPPTRLRIGSPRPTFGGLRWTRSKAWRGLDARDRFGQPVGRPATHQHVQDAGLRRRATAFVGCSCPRSVPDRSPAWSRCRRTRPWTGRPRRRLPAGPIQPVRRRGGGLCPHLANARLGALHSRQARTLRQSAPPRPCPGGHGCSPWTGSHPPSRAHIWPGLMSGTSSCCNPLDMCNLSYANAQCQITNAHCQSCK